MEAQPRGEVPCWLGQVLLGKPSSDGMASEVADPRQTGPFSCGLLRGGPQPPAPGHRLAARLPLPVGFSSSSPLRAWLLLRRGRGPAGRQPLRSASGWEARQGRAGAPRPLKRAAAAGAWVVCPGGACRCCHRGQVGGGPPGVGCRRSRRPSPLSCRRRDPAGLGRPGGGSAELGSRARGSVRVSQKRCPGRSAPLQPAPLQPARSRAPWAALPGAAGAGGCQRRAGTAAPAVVAPWTLA